MLKTEINREVSHAKRNGFTAAVLVAGLALFGCKNDTGYTEMKRISPAKMSAPAASIGDNKGYTEMKKVQHAKLSAPAKELSKGCEWVTPVVPAVNLMSYRKGKCELSEGDSLFKIEFVAEKAGFLAYSISKIDEKGIEVTMNMEIFMSEQASNRAKPWRVEFGQTKPIGENTGLTVKVEKGTTPGTATVEVMMPEDSK